VNWRRLTLMTAAVLVALSGCTRGSGPPAANPAAPKTTASALPAACDLLTPAEVQGAVGVAVRIEAAGGSPDRCRYVSDRGDEIETTVDHPGIDNAVRAYRLLNPDAQPVDDLGDGGALRVGARSGELMFVNGSARFFVVLTSQSPNRDALLAMGRAAAPRM
jgi:hypothetical protein